MKYIIANWKSNGNQQAIAEWCQLTRAKFEPREDRRFVICPPFVYLSLFRELLGELLERQEIFLGGQNLSPYGSGAYTGEVHGGMLADLGCRYVLTGHSERRALFNENDDLLFAKLELAESQHLTSVFCIGETEDAYRAGKTDAVLKEQLRPLLRFLSAGKKIAHPPRIAYEPVWAIGTGLAASPELVNKIHTNIKQDVRQQTDYEPAVLYGGSVKANNSVGFICQPNIDGLLVGGSSLDAAEILSVYSL